jgi:hypothetical protein
LRQGCRDELQPERDQRALAAAGDTLMNSGDGGSTGLSVCARDDTLRTLSNERITSWDTHRRRTRA